MDQTYLLLLALLVIVAITSIGVIRARIRREAPDAIGPESPFAVSTEGMKTCPKCGMGNLWTERRCSSCGTSLKG
jgi:hypothetical protein